MAPPHRESARARNGLGAEGLEGLRTPSPNRLGSSHQELHAKYRNSRPRLHDIGHLVTWGRDLAEQAWRVQTRAEFVGIDYDEHEKIVAEINDFLAVSDRFCGGGH